MTYSEYIHFFQAIGEAHGLIGTVLYGDTSRHLAGERKSLDYPLMIIDDPQTSLEGDPDSMEVVHSGSLIFLDLAGNIDELTDHRMSAMELIMLDVLRYMIKSENIKVPLTSVKYNSVLTAFTNEDVGWELKFTIREPRGLCFPNTSLSVTVDSIQRPHFTYRMVDGDFPNLEILEINTPLPEPDLEWRWKIDNGEMQTSQGAIPDIQNGGKTMLLRCIATQDSFQYVMDAVVKCVAHHGEGFHFRIDTYFK